MRTEMEMIREALLSRGRWAYTSEVTGVSVEDIQHHAFTQEGDVQTDMKFGPEPLQQRHVQLRKCVNSLLLVSGQMGQSGSGLFTGEAELWRGRNVQACITMPRAPRAEVPKGVGAILN